MGDVGRGCIGAGGAFGVAFDEDENFCENSLSADEPSDTERGDRLA